MFLSRVANNAKFLLFMVPDFRLTARFKAFCFRRLSHRGQDGTVALGGPAKAKLGAAILEQTLRSDNLMIFSTLPGSVVLECSGIGLPPQNHSVE